MNVFKTATPRLVRALVTRPAVSRSVAPAMQLTARTFTSSPGLLAKKDKGGKAAKKGGASDSSSAAPVGSASGAEDPMDFSEVEAAWDRTEKHYQEQLKQFKAGGSFNPDVLGALPVTVKEKGSTSVYPLRELAQVVPRTARSLSILAFEKDSIKNIQSAIQASPDFNQQPQVSEDNELELTLKIEATPIEGQLKKLAELCHVWREAIRNGRSKREKIIQTQIKDKTILKDVGAKAKANLLKAMQNRVKAVDTAETQLQNELKRKASQ